MLLLQSALSGLWDCMDCGVRLVSAASLVVGKRQWLGQRVANARGSGDNIGEGVGCHRTIGDRWALKGRSVERRGDQCIELELLAVFGLRNGSRLVRPREHHVRAQG